jgi:hypothetical protein
MFKNSTILHMDLSHCEISKSDGETISKGLDQNHNLLGLHLTGNQITLTADGFITDRKPNSEADSHIMVRMTEHLLMGICQSSLNVELKATTN